MSRINDGSPILETELLRSFLVIAETGNATRAGERIGRTQSAVSLQLRRLEERLGARLFEREARGMTLTEAGRILLPRARALLEDARAIESLFAAPLQGRVRVGLPDDDDAAPLERILTAFRRAHPDVEVSVRTGLSAAFPESVRRGALDLAVTVMPETDGAGRTLARDPLVWAASASFAPRAGGPVPLAVFARDCWWRDAATRAFEAAEIACDICVESESVAGVKAAIRSGLAVGLLSARAVGAGMRVLGPADGMPRLGAARLALIGAPIGSSPAVEAMAAAIESAFSGG